MKNKSIMLLLELKIKISTIPDKSLGTLAHFSSICQDNLSGHPPPPNSVLFIVMKIVIARFQHCRGGRGFLIPVMPLVIVSKIAYQRMFQLFDPGVPRTFVEDCSSICIQQAHALSQTSRLISSITKILSTTHRK